MRTEIESAPTENRTDYSNWSTHALSIELVRLRNELSFVTGDRAHGGPPREAVIESLKQQIDQVRDLLAQGERK